MRNEFIYDIMRSEEIREYYRKNVEFDTEEQILVIMNCYKSLHEQLELFKKLKVPNDDQNILNDVIKFYEIIIDIYDNPTFFSECNVTYAIHSLTSKYNIMHPNIEYTGFLDEYSDYVEYTNNLENTLKENYYNNCSGSYRIDVIVNSSCIVEFYCNAINGQLEPIRFYADNKFFKEYKKLDVIYFSISGFSFKKLPFKNSCKVKFQTPIMKEPHYGIMYTDEDRWDEGYCFMYEEDTTEENIDHKDYIDMSYTNIDHTSNYAIFDWLERLKEE